MSPEFDIWKDWDYNISDLEGFSLQATPEALPSLGEGSIMSQQTTTFVDEVEGVTVGEPTTVNEFEISDATTSADLHDFLSRPVRIFNTTWLESSPVGELASILPWRLFFDNPQIKYKLNNYGFIRANLHLKIVVNASPFYYGAARWCYQPLQTFTPSTIVGEPGFRQLIPFSQRPGLWIYPQHSEGGEMVLPFFFHKNFILVQSAGEFERMGILSLQAYTPLASANGATGQGVSVQVYAWAEDVVLSAPTLGLALQAKDEYGTGPVSRVSSTVARMAGLVKGIPIIGKFATATEMGANAITGIAKLFGFTNVPVINDVAPYRNTAFPQMASTEIGYPIEKLTIDSKNELTIDPSSVGLPSHDELAIEYLVTKPSYLTKFTWDTTHGVDRPLYTTRVTPFQFARANELVYMTPMAMVANLFRSWRGDVIFTFKVVASPYHKGRLQIAYDPVNDSVQTTGVVGSALFNVIVDIGQESEVEVRIPYQRALAWQMVGDQNDLSNVPYSLSNTPTLTTNPVNDNGMLSVKVLTLLTAPISTSAIDVLVSVRGADNFEFAHPTSPGSAYTIFPIQGVNEFSIQAENEATEVPIGEIHDGILIERNRVNFGETVRSLRQVLRRSVFSECLSTSTPATNSRVLLRWITSRFPSYYGYDLNGLSNAIRLVGAGQYPFTFSHNTPYNWIAPCFIGQRGSGHVHMNVENASQAASVACTRNNNSANVATFAYESYAPFSDFDASRWRSTRTIGGGGGMALTNQFVQPGLSVSGPNYSNCKFQSTNPRAITDPPGTSSDLYDGSCFEMLRFEKFFNGTAGPQLKDFRLTKYTSVGTDFNLFFFLNVPTWRVMSTPTASP
jgi:hypothetical protein